MTSERITYKQLDGLLLGLGFSRRHVQPKWLRYEHTESDTVIAVLEKRPDEPLRVTDAVSACRHLVEKGLITETRLESLLRPGNAKRIGVRARNS